MFSRPESENWLCRRRDSIYPLLTCSSPHFLLQQNNPFYSVFVILIGRYFIGERCLLAASLTRALLISPLVQVSCPGFKIWTPGAAGRGGPDASQHVGDCPLWRARGGRQPASTADCHRPEEAAQRTSAAAPQRDPTLPHRR